MPGIIAGISVPGTVVGVVAAAPGVVVGVAVPGTVVGVVAVAPGTAVDFWLLT
jgi:hypothetical protein